MAWFAPIAILFLVFVGDNRADRLATASATALLVVLLAWPVEPTSHRIFSPYQLIERTVEPSTGLMRILSGGHLLSGGVQPPP